MTGLKAVKPSGPLNRLKLVRNRTVLHFAFNTDAHIEDTLHILLMNNQWKCFTLVLPLLIFGLCVDFLSPCL